MRIGPHEGADVEPILYVMAILGCGESDASCRELRIDPVSYQSEASCMAATEEVLIRNDDLPYPTVVAQCRPAGTSPQQLRGSDVTLPDADRHASPRLAEVRMPSIDPR
jgi:hypothetical protein